MNDKYNFEGAGKNTNKLFLCGLTCQSAQLLETMIEQRTDNAKTLQLVNMAKAGYFQIISEVADFFFNRMKICSVDLLSPDSSNQLVGDLLQILETPVQSKRQLSGSKV